MVHFCLQFFIVDKLVMHPCEPFGSGAPLTAFGAPYCAPCTPVEEYWCRLFYIHKVVIKNSTFITTIWVNPSRNLFYTEIEPFLHPTGWATLESSRDGTGVNYVFPSLTGTKIVKINKILLILFK